MPRRIIPIGEENQTSESMTQEERQDTGSQILTSAEMQELLEAWDKSNHSDLIVDEELLSKLRRYVEYEEELTALRKNLARKIWEPYRVEGDILVTDKCDVFLNGAIKGKFVLGRTGNSKMGLVSLRTFKEFMLYFKEPNAIWIETVEDVWADLSMYVAQKNGTFIYSEAVSFINDSKCRITMK